MAVLPGSIIQRRDGSGSTISPVTWVIILCSLAGVLVALFFVRITLKRRAAERTGNGSSNSSRSKSGLKSFFKHFTSQSQYTLTEPSSLNAPEDDGQSANHELRDATTQQTNRMSINRLSVRSIMTLPPYRVAPLPSERLIAKEGERAGVDTVLEYPESDNEAEQRREREMSTLYDIRESRRREQAERAERRRQRQEAVLNGDTRRVAEIDMESRAIARERNTSNASVISMDGERNGSTPGLAPTRANADSALLIAELQSLREHNSRNRRVSSVSYAELGVARHDGSRIRGESIDSDHRPLLDSAASMSGRRDSHSRASSDVSREGSRSRATLAIGRDRRPSTAGSFTSQDDGASLTPLSTNADLPVEPPSYDDDLSVHGGEAPAYESPILTRPPSFPAPTHTEGSSPTIIVKQHDEEPESKRNASISELPQLQLDTAAISITPVIQIVQATPVIPSPASPLPDPRN